jgi:carboxylesterase
MGTVLLLHGFGGTPDDLEPLGVALAARGFVVRAPRLPGHGADESELDRTDRRAWRRAAELALLELRNEEARRPLGVVGYSMGACLAVELAARFPMAAVALLAPAVRPVHRLAFLVPVLAPLAPVARRLGLRVPPLGGLAQVLRLMAESRQEWGRLRAPLLVVQGTADVVVAPVGARELFAAAPSAAKDFVALPGAGHGLLDGEAGRATVARTVAFFERWLGEEQNGGERDGKIG